MKGLKAERGRRRSIAVAHRPLLGVAVDACELSFVPHRYVFVIVKAFSYVVFSLALPFVAALSPSPPSAPCR
uniref:Uncharacterized protein n=1 Tax=Cucumis melo TaxID=3656 RepID=A0A9I9DL00_CUCME